MAFLNIPFETMGLSKFIRLKRYFLSFARRSTPRKIINFLRVEANIFLKKEYVSAVPYILKVENTNICNLQCPVCYEHRKKHDFEGARGFGRMQVNDFKKIVDELHPWLYRINLYGFGEPFLYDEIFEMIRYATDHNISVAITSNFNRIDESGIHRIIDSGLEQLIVSIDGIDQPSYERYKVGGDFSRVVNNIKTLIKVRDERKSRYPLVDWQFLIMRHNINLREEAKRMAEILGIGIRFSRIGVDLKDQDECAEWLPDEQTRRELRFEDQIIRNKKTISVCTWLYRTAFINWDLGVSPCCNYYTGEKIHDFGNMKQQDFLEIWNSPRYRAARSLFGSSEAAFQNDTICSRCVQKRKDIAELPYTSTHCADRHNEV